MTLTAPPAPTLADVQIDKEDRHLLEEYTWFLKQDLLLPTGTVLNGNVIGIQSGDQWGNIVLTFSPI